MATARSMWLIAVARLGIVAVLVAMLSAIVNIGFLAAYPVWSTIMIALDILIIWAVMVHGREMKSV